MEIHTQIVRFSPSLVTTSYVIDIPRDKPTIEMVKKKCHFVLVYGKPSVTPLLIVCLKYTLCLFFYYYYSPFVGLREVIFNYSNWTQSAFQLFFSVFIRCQVPTCTC